MIGCIGRKSVSRNDFPLSVQSDELFRQISNRFLGLFPHLLPFVAAHSVQLRSRPFISDIALQQFQLICRHVQDILAGIMDFQIVLMHAVQLDGLNAFVPADAVGLVDDVVAGLQVRKYVDFLSLGRMMAEAALLHAVYVPLGQNDELGVGKLEAAADFAVCCVHGPFLQGFVCGIQLRLHVLLTEPSCQRRRPLAAAQYEENRIAVFLPVAQLILQQGKLLLKACHHLCGEARRRVSRHVRHGLGHKGQHDLTSRPFCRHSLLPGTEAAFIIVGLLQKLFQAFPYPVGLVPDYDAVADVIENRAGPFVLFFF